MLRQAGLCPVYAPMLRARQANLPTLRHAIKAGTWLIGPPELITEQLMEVQNKSPAWKWSTSASRSARPRR